MKRMHANMADDYHNVPFFMRQDKWTCLSPTERHETYCQPSKPVYL